jgi:hypothetical protein
MVIASDVGAPGADFDAHIQTYRTFVRYGFIFVAHVLLILALMAYFLT